MNKYIAAVIAVVVVFLGLIISYTMGPANAPGATSAQVLPVKDH